MITGLITPWRLRAFLLRMPQQWKLLPFQTEDMARRRSSRKCAVFQQGWDLGQIPAYCPFAVEEQFKDAAEDRREEEEALKRRSAASGSRAVRPSPAGAATTKTNKRP